MVAIVGSFAGLVCVITVFVWLIELIVGNTKIKHSCRKVFFVSGGVFLICGIVTMSTHNKVTSSNVEQRSKRKKVTKLVKKHKKSNVQKVRIYPVTIQEISTTTDGYWIISGKTEAPTNSKIFIFLIASSNDICSLFSFKFLKDCIIKCLKHQHFQAFYLNFFIAFFTSFITIF